MEITIESTVKTTKQIPVPCFWVDKSEITGVTYRWIGLLDEKTLVTIFRSNSRLSITNEIPDNHNLVSVDRGYTLSTEGEFIEAFTSAYTQLSLQPVLV